MPNLINLVSLKMSLENGICWMHCQYIWLSKLRAELIISIRNKNKTGLSHKNLANDSNILGQLNIVNWSLLNVSKRENNKGFLY